MIIIAQSQNFGKREGIKFMKIFYVLFSTWFIHGISQNYKNYSLGDWLVLIFLYFLPMVIRYLILKKHKKKNEKIKKEKIFISKEYRENLKKENENLTKLNNIIPDEEVKNCIKKDYQERLKQVNKILTKNADLYPEEIEKYKLIPDEKLFLDTFFNKVLENKIDLKIRTERKSNGEIYVEYRGCPVGRIRLQGRKHYMQILRGMYGHKIIEGNLENFIQEIPAWIRYVKYLKRNWNK